MERIALLIDQIGKGDNVFEKFAMEFEHSKMEGDWNYSLQDLKEKVELVERKLQDLSEKITAENEQEENIYGVTIQRTKELLSFWLPIFLNRNLAPDSSSFFSKELDELLLYLNIEEIEKKRPQEVKNDFDNLFAISSYEIKKIEVEISPLSSIIDSMDSDGADEFLKEMVKRFFIIVKERKGDIKISNFIIKHTDVSKNLELLKSKLLELHSEKLIQNNFEGDENAIYTAELKLWINTTNASEANRFVNIVTSVLGKIEDVDMTILDSGVSSYWQKIKMRIQGWFAKEETKQILEKGKDALESYTLDRHIEPIKKTQSDRKKTEEEIKRMTPIEHSSELHDIHLQKEREGLKAMQLANLERKIEITKKLSEILALGLVTIDSDYRIELNNLLLFKQENGKLEFGNFEDIDDNLNKELPQAQDGEYESRSNFS